MVMWVYAPPPETSSSPPSAHLTRFFSNLDSGATYASIPIIGFTPAAIAFLLNSYAPKTFP